MVSNNASRPRRTAGPIPVVPHTCGCQIFGYVRRPGILMDQPTVTSPVRRTAAIRPRVMVGGDPQFGTWYSTSPIGLGQQRGGRDRPERGRHHHLILHLLAMAAHPVADQSPQESRGMRQVPEHVCRWALAPGLDRRSRVAPGHDHGPQTIGDESRLYRGPGSSPPATGGYRR
jgi:hypothetical protein